MDIQINGDNYQPTDIIFTRFVFGHPRQKGDREEIPIILRLTHAEFKDILKEEYNEYVQQNMQDGEDSCLKQNDFPDMDRLLKIPNCFCEIMDELIIDFFSLCFQWRRKPGKRSQWILYSFKNIVLDDDIVVIAGTVIQDQ